MGFIQAAYRGSERCLLERVGLVFDLLCNRQQGVDKFVQRFFGFCFPSAQS